MTAYSRSVISTLKSSIARCQRCSAVAAFFGVLRDVGCRPAREDTQPHGLRDHSHGSRPSRSRGQTDRDARPDRRGPRRTQHRGGLEPPCSLRTASSPWTARRGVTRAPRPPSRHRPRTRARARRIGAKPAGLLARAIHDACQNIGRGKLTRRLAWWGTVAALLLRPGRQKTQLDQGSSWVFHISRDVAERPGTNAYMFSINT